MKKLKYFNRYYLLLILRRIQRRILLLFPIEKKEYDIKFHLNSTIRFVSVNSIPKKIIFFYLNHRFNLLGSGWIKWERENYNNDGYKPIDWHVDIKSGFRWNSLMWYQDCLKTIGAKEGIDIKMPWELSRLQHLPQMALYALDKGERYSEFIYQEIDYQICDFIKNNPVRYGVNWACPMDVGIRMVNILLTYDIIQAKKEINIDSKILSSAYVHAKFICQNLEYTKVPNNHYFANICSLIIISSYLKPSTETISWLAFGLQELVKETEKQFYDDGVNFESSTSYHRLSTEILIYTMAYLRSLSDNHIEKLKKYKRYHWKYIPFLKGINQQKWKINKGIIELPVFMVDLVVKAIEFTSNIKKPDNTVPQFGDNDSGRFIKLTPVGEFIKNKEAQDKYVNLSGYLDKVKSYGDTKDSLFWDENSNIHDSLLAIGSGLFHDNSLYKKECDTYNIEYNLIKAIVKVPYKKTLKENIKKIYINKMNDIDYMNFPFKKVTEYNSKLNLINNLKCSLFSKSGFCIFKGENLFLIINYGAKTMIKGGHLHNDRLSYELTIGNENIITDPGTYVYSPDPILRKKFRSNSAHQVIIVDEIEQNNIDRLFSSDIQSLGYLLRLESTLAIFLLKHESYMHVREFIITSNKLIINDYCNKNFRYPDKFGYYSSGYGKLEKVN